MDFKLLHTDPYSSARAGIITTDHGQIETPIFMPVGTVASVKGVHIKEVKEDLLSSENYLRLANNDTEDLTIKRLTRGNPTMKQKFDEARNTQIE
jgi:hypothetical protein